MADNFWDQNGETDANQNTNNDGWRVDENGYYVDSFEAGEKDPMKEGGFENFANLDVPEKVKAGIGLGAKIIETIFALAFPIAWIGFVSVATVLLVMQKDWEMVPIVIPFWLAGVFVVVSAVRSVIRIFRK